MVVLVTRDQSCQIPLLHPQHLLFLFPVVILTHLPSPTETPQTPSALRASLTHFVSPSHLNKTLLFLRSLGSTGKTHLSLLY